MIFCAQPLVCVLLAGVCSLVFDLGHTAGKAGSRSNGVLTIAVRRTI